jgi:hypothetical protein
MPRGSAANLEAISRYADGIMGNSAQDFHEIYSPDIHVDLLHYAPSKTRDFHYVVTSGMSDAPMTDGDSQAACSRLELVMALPSHWNVSPEGFKDPPTWRPFRLLKAVARYPHCNRTYFARGHTAPLEHDPLLSPMVAVLLMPPILVPEFGRPLDIGQGKKIEFLAVYLIHQDELDLKLNGSFDQLLAGFAKHELTELYDPTRPSVLS